MPRDLVVGGVIHNNALVPAAWSDAGETVTVAPDFQHKLKHSTRLRFHTPYKSSLRRQNEQNKFQIYISNLQLRKRKHTKLENYGKERVARIQMSGI